MQRSQWATSVTYIKLSQLTIPNKIFFITIRLEYDASIEVPHYLILFALVDSHHIYESLETQSSIA